MNNLKQSIPIYIKLKIKYNDNTHIYSFLFLFNESYIIIFSDEIPEDVKDVVNQTEEAAFQEFVERLEAEEDLEEDLGPMELGKK